jgi:glycosyltransferase involved in cell wall biosynthesis
MTRVAFVTERFPDPARPGQVDWLAAVQARGIGVEVFAEQVGEPDRPIPFAVRALGRGRTWGARENAVGLGRAWARAHYLLREAPSPKQAVRAIARYLPALRHSVDLLHFDSAHVLARWRLLPKLLEAPALVTLRGADLADEDVCRSALCAADHVLVASRHLLAEAQRLGCAKPISVVPEGVGTDFFCPAAGSEPPSGAYRLISCGELTWQTGPEFAVQAVALLVKRGLNVEYCVAGDGDMREAVLYTAAELGILNRVRVCSYLAAEVLRDSLRQCNAYVAANVAEDDGVGPLLAQACGVPVVCTDAGALPEMVEDGVTGLLAKRRDAWDLAEKLAAVLGNPGQLTAMGLRARWRARALFSTSQRAERMASVYGALSSARVAVGAGQTARIGYG